jgi:hypothetical protein
MNDSTDLERRYRRLTAFYPKAFRRERQQELVSVLMAGAGEGQRWPRPAEATDLCRNGISLRLRLLKHPTSMELRHPGPWVLCRVLVGLWLMVATAILCQSSLWGLTLLVPAALHFYLAYRVAAPIEAERWAGGPPPTLGA